MKYGTEADCFDLKNVFDDYPNMQMETQNMKHIIYTQQRFAEMKLQCYQVVGEFCSQFDKIRDGSDSNDPDCDVFAIPMEEIQKLFNKLSTIMNLNTTLRSFRDNETEYGRYSEYNDCVCLPLCIDMYSTKEICEHICHELFHAFQYYAICYPIFYPCFGTQTIEKWKGEFEHYYNGADNEKYISQEIEQSARNFARSII